jgi:hypothetical protein
MGDLVRSPGVETLYYFLFFFNLIIFIKITISISPKKSIILFKNSKNLDFSIKEKKILLLKYNKFNINLIE